MPPKPQLRLAEAPVVGSSGGLGKRGRDFWRHVQEIRAWVSSILGLLRPPEEPTTGVHTLNAG
jgi:hypothetical protein